MAKVRFTAQRVAQFTCPDGRDQAFLWDLDTKGLGLRITGRGSSAFIFQSEYQGKTLRMTIGAPGAWTIPQAQERARELQRELDKGQDPRDLKRAAIAEATARAEAEKAQSLTVAEAWARYLSDRRPFWGERNYTDHLAMARPGGEERERRPGVKTKSGPLASMMAMRLCELTPDFIEGWAAKEVLTRPARVRLALRLLKAFLRWAATESDLKELVDATAASAKRTRDLAGKPKAKNDYLQREQLPAWFAHVRQIQNPVIAAYLQCLLLTGARREELAALKWSDLNFQWRGMTIRDKIEGQRAVPLTPYVGGLMAALPRRNEWVFSSATSDSGRMVEPSIAHRQACAASGLHGLTLHGLRRSFASLCEWLDIPGGISAQIQGHAPQGVREQNYIRRPLDLLRVHHERIERWLLEQAGLEPPADVGAPRLKAVA